VVAVVAAAPAPAQVVPVSTTDTGSVVSHNWAGYVVTPKTAATRFTSVSATWVVPHGRCDSAHRGRSSTWVGIGGFKRSSGALEQTGTDFDCVAHGGGKYSAWYELLPAPARSIRMTVRPGDTIRAAVTVRGKRVTISLRNSTRGKVFRRTFTVKSPAASSAEWIVEAPSVCKRGRRCTELPLSNFGSVSFRHARAVTETGRRGGIAHPRWANTKLELSQGERRQGSAQSAGARAAQPSSLRARGTAFSVSYKE
jgi:hypothetical protein